MPYCGKCGVEYVEGTTQCEDCGAFLLPGSPPADSTRLDFAHDKDSKLVPLRTFTGDSGMGAEVARGVLESQGIPCMISGDLAGEPFPVANSQVMVREQDVARAERILRDYTAAGIPEAPDQSESVN